jgi:hypothetical protein
VLTDTVTAGKVLKRDGALLSIKQLEYFDCFRQFVGGSRTMLGNVHGRATIVPLCVSGFF